MDTLHKHDLSVSIIETQNEQTDGYQIAKKLHQKKQLPDYVFSLSDHSALGFIRFLNEIGISIPETIDIDGAIAFKKTIV